VISDHAPVGHVRGDPLRRRDHPNRQQVRSISPVTDKQEQLAREAMEKNEC
jgi:hypothetical protein